MRIHSPVQNTGGPSLGPRSLGASLTSVALLAGTIAWTLGWFVPEASATSPILDTNGGAGMAVTLPAPPKVVVTRLPRAQY